MSKRILVVEDQPDNRQIIRDMLAPTDYESLGRMCSGRGRQGRALSFDTEALSSLRAANTKRKRPHASRSRQVPDTHTTPAI